MKLILFAILAVLMAGAALARDDAADLYRSPGKQRAPVALVTGAVYRARVGEPLKIPLVFDLDAPASGVRVQIHASEGLLLERNRIERRVGDLSSGRVELAPLLATVVADGHHRIAVTVFLRSGGYESFRAFVIPVEGGDLTRTPTPKRANISVDHTGRPIHILPAR